MPWPVSLNGDSTAVPVRASYTTSCCDHRWDPGPGTSGSGFKPELTPLLGLALPVSETVPFGRTGPGGPSDVRIRVRNCGMNCMNCFEHGIRTQVFGECGTGTDVFCLRWPGGSVVL